MCRRWTECCLVVVLAVSVTNTPAVAFPQSGPDAQAAALKDYEATVSHADALVAAGDYFEAVRQYERAGRVAYNNKLTVDKVSLESKLAVARQLRDAKKNAPAPAAPPVPGAAPPAAVPASGDRLAAGASYVDLTTPLATGPRVVTSRTVPPDQSFGPSDEKSRWVVTNPFLPVDRKFFEKVFLMACAADGSLYLAGGSLVSATETGRQPIGNKGFYAGNGSGIWRVAPNGAITAFGVRPSGSQPGWDHVTAQCNVRVADAGIDPEHWGGMAVDGAGNLFVSDSELNLILEFTPNGRVEHVAGGGPQACMYDRWKTLQKGGYLDGPAGLALFSHPAGLAFDRAGNLLVADTGNCALRRIDPRGNVTTVRKGCEPDDRKPGDDNAAIRYEFLAIDRDGLPVVGGARFSRMEQYGDIFRVFPDGRAEQLLAGRRFRPQSRQQELGYLSGIAVLPDGAVLITDSNPEASRVYEVREGRLFVVAGLGGDDMLQSDVDGPAAQARIRQPGGLCAVPDGTIFVRPDHGGRPLRRIDPQTHTVSTWVY